MTETQRDAILDGLRTSFGGEVDAEAVNDRGRYRFAVVSPKFQGMPHLRRQDEAWEVVDGIVPRDVSLDISLILTLAPSETEVAAATPTTPAQS